MDKSKVYFTDFRAKQGMNVLQKLDRLIREAGIDKIDFKNKFVAIKIHFGEPGNIAYLRPNFAKVVADYVKEKGRISIFDRLQYTLCRKKEKRPRAY